MEAEEHIDRDALSHLVESFADEHRCPSISWGVVLGGRLAAAGAVGSVRGRTPTEHTVYRIASMTKSFSSALTLLLRDDGVLSLDAPIHSYAPELSDVGRSTADAAPITIRDLLCMSSGLVTDDAWADRHLDLTDGDFDAAIAAGLVFAESPGIAFEYSNFGFALLGRVVHRATGLRLQDLVDERLLTPLGMSQTSWHQPPDDRWAPPLRRLDDGWSAELPTPGDGMIAPMGGLWTTVSDLAVWVGWLADAFPPRDDTDGGPLTRASRREMQTPQRYVGLSTLRGVSAPSSYGYGLRISHEPRHGPVVLHSGGLPGYGSGMRWGRDGCGVIALSNVTYAPMTLLAARLHDLLDEQGVAGRSPRTVHDDVARLGHSLVSVLNRWAAGERVPVGDLDDLFADNVAPDDDYQRRAERARGHGALTIERIEALNEARGRVVCTTTIGRRATVAFALAPVLPARIQQYDVELVTD